MHFVALIALRLLSCWYWIEFPQLLFSLVFSLDSDKMFLLHTICRYREEYVQPTITVFTKEHKCMAGCIAESSAAYNTNRGIDLQIEGIFFFSVVTIAFTGRDTF